MASFSYNIFSFCACLVVLSLLVSPGFTANPPPKPRAVLLPVTRDAATCQYVTSLRLGTPLRTVRLVVDLGERYTWIPCDNGSYASFTLRPVRCNTPSCRKSLFSCRDGNCGGFSENPFTHLSTPAVMKEDFVSVQSTDGKNPRSPVTFPRVGLACSNKDLLKGLAEGSFGIAAFSRNTLALPTQLSSGLGSRDVSFALCLPSSGAGAGRKGMIFVGDLSTEYWFTTKWVVIPDSSVNTPLLTNPVSNAGVSFAGEPSYEYFIKVVGIQVNEEELTGFDPSLLVINSNGCGGTKLSTVDPYTALETSIYKALAKAFTRMLGLDEVAPIAPFSTCYDAQNTSSSFLGPAAPYIELTFDKDKGHGWVFFGSNSLVRMNPDVLCLAFVDGGKNPTTSIVIGGYQMEDNFLQFDLVQKRLSVSGTLRRWQTTCADFNSTSVVP